VAHAMQQQQQQQQQPVVAKRVGSTMDDAVHRVSGRGAVVTVGTRFQSKQRQRQHAWPVGNKPDGSGSLAPTAGEPTSEPSCNPSQAASPAASAHLHASVEAQKVQLPMSPRKSCDRAASIGHGMSPAKVRSAAELNSLSDSLQEAALALRRIIPVPQSARATDNASSGQQEDAHLRTQHRGLSGGRGPITNSVTALLNSHMTPPHDGDLGPKGFRSCPGHSHGLPGLGETIAFLDPSLGPTIKRLIQENMTLREAFDDASQRLAMLEEEKWRFLDEGVFDLVNSVCVRKTPNLRKPHQLAIAVPPISTFTPLSPAASAASVRRYEEDKRSSELSGENEELRQELARASEVGEALEQQQQAAEDRMYALEQEQALLANQLSRFGADQSIALATPTRGKVDGTPRASGVGGTLGARAELELRRRLEDLNSILRAEMRELPPSALRQRALSTGSLLSTSVLRSAVGDELEDCAARDRFGSEDAAAQKSRRAHDAVATERAEALERRLWDSEARAEALAEENARLLVRLSMRTPSETCRADAYTIASGGRPDLGPRIGVSVDAATTDRGQEDLIDSGDCSDVCADSDGNSNATSREVQDLLPLDIEDAW